LNYNSHNRLIAGNFGRATNPHPHPTDFTYEIRIHRIRLMRILAGSVTSLQEANQNINN